MKKSTAKLRILTIEDNAGDLEILKGLLRSIAVEHEMTAFDTGEKALEHIKNQWGSENLQSPLPDLIFLDLKLPKMSGLDVLNALKDYDRIYSIPVIVLTVSDEPLDVVNSYKLGGTFFMKKSWEKGILGDVITHLRTTGRIKNPNTN